MRKWKSPSFEMNRRAELSIAHGALTNSKRPSCLVKNIYPTHLKEGRGCVVTDIDGNHYVDFITGLGSSILGYGNNEIAYEIGLRARMGCTLSLGTDLEVQTAEKVKEIFPFIHKLRFLKTGTDACNAAIRIARAKTGRAQVLSEGYHGWGDEFVGLTPPALGVPVNQVMLKLNKIADITEATAAVIVEPIITDHSEARIEWLKTLREKCTQTGAILIFDEIITGFRWPKFSVSNYYGITPDLICLGKAMANGMPIAVVGGHRDVMDCGEWFVSSTFAGETLSLAAALKTMTLLQTKYSLENLWARGELFQEKFNALMPQKLWIEGYPTRGVFRGDDLTKALFWQEACKAGLMFGPSFFFNFAHIDFTDQVLSVCSDIMEKLKSGVVQLQGEMPSSPFAQKMREAK